MDGAAGQDGTFFDAAAAVKAGIIPESHVLRTSKQLRAKVRADLSGHHGCGGHTGSHEPHHTARG